MSRRRRSGRRLHGALRWSLLALILVSAVTAAFVLHGAAAVRSAWNTVERVPLDAPATAAAGSTPGMSRTVEATNGPAGAGGDPAGADDGTAAPTGVPPSSAPDRQPNPAPTHGGEVTTTTPPTQRSTSPGTGSPTSEAELVKQAQAPPRAIALVGSDSRAGLDDLANYGHFPGKRADVIMLAVRTDEDPVLISIPRDLYVRDQCRGGHHRIGEAYAGCPDRNGLANLVAELEELIGLRIQHAAALDMAGFQAVVDTLGGYRICTEHPVRDPKTGLSLEAGCRGADGETTLAWIRSRHTQELVDGQWRTMEGVSDLTRNRRQRQFLLDMFERLADRSDPGTVLDTLRSVAPYMTVDDGLSMRDAAAWAWRFRKAEIEIHSIPVTTQTTEGGASVLVPTRSVPTVVRELTS